MGRLLGHLWAAIAWNMMYQPACVKMRSEPSALAEPAACKTETDAPEDQSPGNWDKCNVI